MFLKSVWAATPPRLQRRLKIAGVIALCILVPVQLFLTFGLTPLVRKYAIPEAERALGVPVTVDRVSANLLWLSANVLGLKVGNPTSFDEPTAVSVGSIRANVGFFRLLVGVVEVSTRVRDLKLTVVRNSAGQTNIVCLQQSVAAHTPTSAVPPTAAANLPRILIGNVRADAALEYIDHQATNGPFRLGCAVTVKAHQILTYKPWSTNHWGTFSVAAQLSDKPGKRVIDIQGKVAPIIDPKRPTFEVNATITNLNLAAFGPLLVEAGVKSGTVGADLHLVCKDGTFQSESVVIVRTRDVKLAGGTSKRMLGATIPSTLAIQLKGTVEKPDFDLMGTLLRMTGKGLSHGVDKVMDEADGFFKWLSRPATNRFEKKSGGAAGRIK